MLINRERLAERFLSYVRVGSESFNEKTFGEYLKNQLETIGCEVEVNESEGAVSGSNYGNLKARLKGNSAGESALFSCHLDTVVPGKAINPVIKDGVVTSDGTTILGADDKAGITALVEAVATIQENGLPHADIEMVFSFLEERGLVGAKVLDLNWFTANDIYVLDGGDVGRIVFQGPAQNILNIWIEGKPSHAGTNPENGISAIQVAAQAVSNMKLLRIDEETTANVGTFYSKGQTNIVAAKAHLEAEARSLSQDKLVAQTAHMRDCFEKAAAEAGATVKIEVEEMYPAYKIDTDDPIILRTSRVMKEVGMNPSLYRTGGGSDANIFNGKGKKAIALGTGQQKAHTFEENVSIDDMVQVSRLIMALVEDYLE